MFNLFGLNIHLYGLLIGLGVWVGFEIALSRQKNPIEKKVMENILLWVILGGVMGARIYHVIDFWQRYYQHNPIKVFYVWEGGLGIWGAIIGGILAIGIYSRLKKLNFLVVLDQLIIGVPVAQAIGRLGNWVNGELYGKNREPLFAYEAILNLILFGILWRVSRRKLKLGELTGFYLVGYGVIRLILEEMRPDGIIWKIGNVPVAVIFGLLSILCGICLVVRIQYKLSKSKYSTGA